MTNFDDLTRKHILVTGAAGLLGSAIVKGFDNYRCKLTLFDPHTEALVALQRNLQSKTKIAAWGSLLDPLFRQRFLSDVEAEFGPVDVLAHIAYPRTSDWHLKLESIPVESWQKNIDMNLDETFALTQIVGTAMAQRHGGSIILYSSIYGLGGPDFSVYEGLESMTMPAAYSAIKGAISNYTRYLGSYWAKKHVRVNAICPGGIFNAQPPSFVSNYCARVPMGRMGAPEDIVGPTLFLASDLSSYITGINLPVDGGWTAI